MRLLSHSPRLRGFSAAALGISLCVFVLTGTTANAVDSNVAISFTPTFNTQFALNTPTGVIMNPDGSPTAVPFTISSWSEFPLNRVLVCYLVGNTPLANGSVYIEPILKVGDVVIHDGDAIFVFQPTTVNSPEGMEPMELAVLTVEASESSRSGKFSANISYRVSVLDAKEYFASVSAATEDKSMTDAAATE